MPRPLFISHVMSKMLNSDTCGHQGVNSHQSLSMHAPGCFISSGFGLTLSRDSLLRTEMLKPPPAFTDGCDNLEPRS